MAVTDTPLDHESDLKAVSLLTDIIQALVDEPDAVHIHPLVSEQLTIFEVSVESEDIRRVIGRKGRTADALRHLLVSLGGKARRRYLLEILEPSAQVTIALDC